MGSHSSSNPRRERKVRWSSLSPPIHHVFADHWSPFPTAALTTLPSHWSLPRLSSPFRSISLQKSKNTSLAALDMFLTHALTPRKPRLSSLPRAPPRSAFRPFFPCTFRLLHRSRGAQLPLRPCPSWTTTTTIGPSRSTSTASRLQSSACPPLRIFSRGLAFRLGREPDYGWDNCETSAGG